MRQVAKRYSSDLVTVLFGSGRSIAKPLEVNLFKEKNTWKMRGREKMRFTRDVLSRSVPSSHLT